MPWQCEEGENSTQSLKQPVDSGYKSAILLIHSSMAVSVVSVKSKKAKQCEQRASTAHWGSSQVAVKPFVLLSAIALIFLAYDPIRRVNTTHLHREFYPHYCQCGWLKCVLKQCPTEDAKNKTNVRGSRKQTANPIPKKGGYLQHFSWSRSNVNWLWHCVRLM